MKTTIVGFKLSQSVAILYSPAFIFCLQCLSVVLTEALVAQRLMILIFHLHLGRGCLSSPSPCQCRIMAIFFTPPIVDDAFALSTIRGGGHQEETEARPRPRSILNTAKWDAFNAQAWSGRWQWQCRSHQPGPGRSYWSPTAFWWMTDSITKCCSPTRRRTSIPPSCPAFHQPPAPKGNSTAKHQTPMLGI